MNYLDIYYRAFKEYRRETAEDSTCKKDRRLLSQSNIELDKLSATKYLCKIDVDWIEAIEQGLEYVEKAVAEERQFIRTNGEVVPIEKVKKISKDSVEHLARHSDMITHVPEEEDDLLIPDKLYMVEKLSDYAVYENRFLYMMLCYIRDFIQFRLEKIEKLRATYVGEMSVSKEVATKKRTLKVETKVFEERTDNPFPIADETSAGLVKRISNCNEIINSLLNTDLMQQVAKTPMIKPPIVKTNVLKMNNNFKRSLALYDYIASYNGDGFSYEEVNFDFAPFSETVADEIAEAVNLPSFIAYKIGNNIEDILESAYKEEEQRRNDEEAKLLANRLRRLKKRALESNKTMEEYMLLLEERIRQLEKDCEELVLVRQELQKLNDRVNELNLEKNELNRRIEELQKTVEEKEQEIIQLNQKYIEDMAALRAEHEKDVARIREEHEGEIQKLKADFADELNATISAHEQRVGQLNGEIESMKAEMTRMSERDAGFDNEKKQISEEFELRLKELEETHKTDLETQEKANSEEVSKIKHENALIRAELNSMRIGQGKLAPSTDYSSRERFVELEEEYMAFQKFFKEQWTLTKKEIRKQLLWTKQEKADKKPRK